MSEALQKTGLEPSSAITKLRDAALSAARSWNAVSAPQKKRAMLSAALGVLIVGGLLWWAWRPSWRLLYSNLAPEDSRQMAALLTGAGIQYDVSPDGTVLRVPAQMLDKARLATVSKAAGKSGKLGFELFDKPNWAGSDFDEKVNYQRALEGELEHTIGTLADVQSCRVHIVFSHDALFTEQQRDAKASVVLSLKRKSLGEEEADSIRNLVASAVDGLSADKVVLVDADGHSPLRSSGHGVEENAACEETLAERIVQTLEPVAGEGNVRATVTIDHDTSSSDELDEKYDPSAVVTLSMQRSEQTAGEQTPAAGIPGTSSNAPNQQLPLFPAKATGTQSSKQEAGTYGASKKTVHLVQGPGKLRRITAAVLVNDRIVPAASKKEAARSVPYTSDEMKQLQALVQAAIGYEAARGDQVSVQNLRFEVPAKPSGLFENVSRNSGLLESALRYLTIAFVALLTYMFVLRPIVKPQTEIRSAAELPAPGNDDGAAAATTPAQLQGDADGAKLLFDQVADHIQRDPEQSAHILQTWIKAE